MNRKLKNTIALAVILIVICLLGGIYGLVVQKNKIKDKTKRYNELNMTKYDTETLNVTLNDVKLKASKLDSILAARKFNIPAIITQTKFYDFVNRISFPFSQYTHIDVEFVEAKKEKDFNYYSYKLSGIGSFNDVYNLIYSIEQSKELKKIKNVKLTNFISVDETGTPRYMVNFDFTVRVYFALNDRFTTKNLVENNLTPAPLYDMFYPLVRNELPPNVDGLLEVESARLLALTPEGAFIADAKGNTFMLWEGDEVYLGYLTKINFDRNMVTFILNKGGIIEKVNLELEKEEKSKEKIK